MKRAFFQFTLRRALLGIAVVAAFLGIVSAYPWVVLRAALFGGLFFPTIAASVLLACGSPRRVVTLSAALCGAGAALLVSPRLNVSWSGAATWWDVYLLSFETKAVPAMIGAVIVGYIVCVCTQSQPR